MYVFWIEWWRLAKDGDSICVFQHWPSWGCRPPRHSTLSTLSTHRHMIKMTMVSKMVMMRLMVMKFLKTMIVMMMTMLARWLYCALPPRATRALRGWKRGLQANLVNTLAPAREIDHHDDHDDYGDDDDGNDLDDDVDEEKCPHPPTFHLSWPLARNFPPC